MPPDLAIVEADLARVRGRYLDGSHFAGIVRHCHALLGEVRNRREECEAAAILVIEQADENKQLMAERDHLREAVQHMGVTLGSAVEERDAATSTLAEVTAERDRLREMFAEAATRIAKQSDVLSKRAEGTPLVSIPIQCVGYLARSEALQAQREAYRRWCAVARQLTQGVT